MANFIPYGRQEISQEDLEAVKEVLCSDWLTQGPAVTAFEAALKNYGHVNYAVACCNATAALHLACKALGVGPGDYVWTSPNTFTASANCARFCGAEIDFVDIDPDTYNLCVFELEKKLIQAQKNNQLPKVVIPVHFAGQSCDMATIKKLADQYGFKIIEDASHAIGGKYLGQPIGSCSYSDITVFSFHPVKIITTGEGGACLTNNGQLAETMSLLRAHGITRDPAKMLNPCEGAWYYEQVDLGFNYRITDMQCALGVSQIKRLNSYIDKRNEIAEQYQKLLKDLPLKLPMVKKDGLNAFHLYVVQILPESGKNRKEIFDYLRANQIGVNVHYIPVHRQPYYENLGFKKGDFPVAEKYYENAISLPMYPGLTQEDLARVASLLEMVFTPETVAL